MNPREQMVELLTRLEQASVENAKAFIVVTTDAYSGDVMNSTGPFEQPEQALAEAGRIDQEWRDQAENEVEANALRHVVIPMFEPRR